MEDKKYKYTISFKDELQEVIISWDTEEDGLTYDRLVDMFRQLSSGLGYHNETIKEEIGES